MENLISGTYIQGTSYPWFVLLVIWLCGFQHVFSRTANEPRDKLILSNPPTGLFGPIDISPSVLPHNISPAEPLSPVYPNFTTYYDPVLTGRCPVNFSSISSITERTASDCTVPLAPLVADVICCPQVNSLMNIFQSVYSKENNSLVLNQALTNDCFSDIMSILASRGASTNIPVICSVKPSNLSDALCPVKDVSSFERMVNTSKLLDACSSIDTLQECCRPTCQPAIMEAAVQISSGEAGVIGSSGMTGTVDQISVVNDCKGVVYSWLSRELSYDDANTAFRVLSGCKVNKGCPLELEDPSSVVKACGDTTLSSSSCCTALHSYMSTRKNQIFVTNVQAIICATKFGSALQKAGVASDVYGMCGIDLKDFSLQAFGQQGCLLRTLPTDIVYDNTTGISFTCDLIDNIAAPWPSSSAVSSVSFCAPEMSLPALPLAHSAGNSGHIDSGYRVFLLLFCVALLVPIRFTHVW